ncbi:hypothetical protein ACHAW5_002871 [Stephanodiscus triporus]|uniref:Multidrug and toxin extrusion protein n=1 Tax=Stephanodiscus triporus TaxID=2934178 RepID=A0ABD3P9H1_9STRA
MRRSSINEDLLRRRYSSAPAPDGLRLSSALESLSLLVTDDLDDLETSTKSHVYGAIENAAADVDGVVADLSVAALKAKVSAEAAILKDELWAMTTLALPVIVTYVLELLPGIITLVLVGRMDNGENTKLYVDAAALAVMLYNIVGLTTGLGILTALDTLCASAHGANQPSKMGRFLLTGIVIMSILFCFVGVVLCNTTSILLLLRQPAAVAHHAGIFVLWMLPGLPFLYAYELLRKLSQARNETVPMIVSAVVCLLVNVGSGYYMVSYTRLGWIGAALARTLGTMTMVPTVFVGMYCTDREFLAHVWSGFRVKEAITKKAITKFLSLGIPGALQLMFEWIAFEILALECGILPDENQAIVAIGANAISLQISSVMYMLYLGASVAGSIRIGNALGAGDTHRAKVASYLALALGVLLSCVNIMFILSRRLTLPSFFTSDEDLIRKTQDLLLVFAYFQLPDAVNGIDQGIFRAIGKQSLAAKLNAIAYYAVGIPLGYLLGLSLGLGVEGLWYGLVAGLIWGATLNTIILLRLDWEQLSLDTERRLSIAHGDEYINA